MLISFLKEDRKSELDIEMYDILILEVSLDVWLRKNLINSGVKYLGEL